MLKCPHLSALVLICASVAWSADQAVPADPVAALPASEFDGRVSSLIEDFDKLKEQDQKAVDKLLADLAALGADAQTAMLKAFPAAAKRKSLATGVLACVLMRQKSPLATPVLVHVLKSDVDVVTQWNILTTLKAIGSPAAIPALMDKGRILADAPTDTPQARIDVSRTQALLTDALQQIGSRSDGDRQMALELEQRLRDSTPKFKVWCASVLGTIRSRLVEDLLLAMATDADPLASGSAIAALGSCGSPRIAPRLLPYLESKHPRIVCSTCLVLGRVKALVAIPRLTGLLASKDEAVANAAVSALRSITRQDYSTAEEWTRWHTQEKLQTDLRLQALLAEIKAGPQELAPIAIEALGELELARDRLVDALAVFVDNSNFRIRAATCNALAQSTDPRAQDVLLRKLTDSSPVVARSAWRGLRYSTGKSFPLDPAEWRAYLAQGR
jgi:HEAT repeat protein